MGGNLASSAGAPEDTLAAAALRLGSLGRVVRRSSLYSTAPVGFAEQPRFVNAVVALETDLTPLELLDGLLAIEKEFGRDRSAGIANGPRTLDLDILLLGGLEIRELRLLIPHPRLAVRAFVLAPLNEIAAPVIVPGCGKSVEELFGKLNDDPRSESDAAVRIENEVWSKSQSVEGHKET
jgi:2-amino-4-hydroxy-6-hydroxymethyldihydropteridine diphosphokinase